MDKYQVNFIFCNKYLYRHGGQHLSDRLNKSPDWVLIFEDDLELLFIRNSPKNYAIINKARTGGLKLPRTPYRLGNEALDMIRRGDYKKARMLLNEALTIDPHNGPNLMKAGFIELVEGHRVEAEKLYQKVLSLNPRYPAANYYLGRIAQKAGHKARPDDITAGS